MRPEQHDGLDGIRDNDASTITIDGNDVLVPAASRGWTSSGIVTAGGEHALGLRLGPTGAGAGATWKGEANLA
ncbi:hypothetical protein [Labrys wisconsinensis]|uniref:Uncharacterized protein n=1 Tax=Labrys wisconsinensis TaxID=425677 RepID=A0ABU0JHU2_9HYPH|nr:hypothetical protein [Labrys wisconsinensis]MDQ0473839.1 hypothetical protein [Labrys wisconsinensis]